MLIRPAELGQQGREVFRLGDDVRRSHEILHLHLVHAEIAQRTEEIADVQDADDVVERLAVDGIARVGGIHDRFETLLGREVDRKRHDLGAGDHHV